MTAIPGDMQRNRRMAVCLLAFAPALTDPLGAQSAREALERAVTQAGQAWIRHDLRALVGSSDTVRLQLPGVRAPVVRPSQAAMMLADYLKSDNEITFEMRRIRIVNDDHAYAEMVRVFVVEGTADKRTETVFLGFRLHDEEWRIREVRVTP